MRWKHFWSPYCFYSGFFLEAPRRLEKCLEENIPAWIFCMLDCQTDNECINNI